MPAPSQKRMKRTRYQRLVEDRKAEKRKHYRKQPVRITQQPTKKRDCYAGRCTWEWKSGPDKGKKYNQPVSLPYPFDMKLRGRDLVILPHEGDEYVWGEGQSAEVKREQERAKQPPLPAEKGKRVKSMLDLLREKLEALIEKEGPLEAGKSMARAFILAHNKLSNKTAKRALAKLYAAVLKDSNRAAFLSFGAHLRSSASMTKKTTAAVGKIDPSWEKKARKLWEQAEEEPDPKKRARLLEEAERALDMGFEGFETSASTSIVASHIVVAAGTFGDNTLEQLVGMSIETMFSDHGGGRLLADLVRGGVKLSNEVKRAASAYEDAAEAALEALAGEDAASEAMDNDAPYLMWMTQEGHGVGINDGDLDDIDGLDLRALRKMLDKDRSLIKAHAALKTAIDENAYEEVQEALEELASEAKSAVESAMTEREEQETDPQGSVAGEVAGWLGDQITYSYNTLKDFAENNRDRYNEDLAEAILDAFNAGMDEDEIYDAVSEVGEVEWVDGIGATRGFSLGGGGEVQLVVEGKRIKVDNDYGSDTDVAELATFLEGYDDMDVKLDFEIDRNGDITEYRSLDGYWNWDVDPRALRRKLGV